MNGNNMNINNETNDDSNTANTANSADNSDTNSNLDTTADTTANKNCNPAKKHIKKSGPFSKNYPRNREILLECVNGRTTRHSSTTVSELSYNSDVVVHRSGNVAKVLLNVGNKSEKKNIFNADVSVSIYKICVYY